MDCNLYQLVSQAILYNQLLAQTCNDLSMRIYMLEIIRSELRAVNMWIPELPGVKYMHKCVHMHNPLEAEPGA
jgi:hypothetical protein